MISEVLKARIKELDLSVPQAAKRCGIGVATMYSCTTYNKTPSGNTLRKISVGLNIDPKELLKEPEPVYPSTDEFRRAPGADELFGKNGFYYRMSPEDKAMLESVLQNIKKRYGGGK